MRVMRWWWGVVRKREQHQTMATCEDEGTTPNNDGAAWLVDVCYSKLISAEPVSQCGLVVNSCYLCCYQEALGSILAIGSFFFNINKNKHCLCGIHLDYMDYMEFPHMIVIHSMWKIAALHGLCIHSMWSPCGLNMVFTWNLSPKFACLCKYMESMWSPGVHMESTWSPHGNWGRV